MSIRAFPRTKREPNRRVLLIPVVLLVAGLILNFIPLLRFFGTILALTGVMSVFLVGMVYADLYASSRRSKDIIKAREARDAELEASDGESTKAEPEDFVVSDPFEESFGDEDA
ncbi:MAG: hypothetical protein EAX95_09605 [Candidatus Thorarchaeota archaeon]|nr:hypothetical protein [Candidatus Thorarchaeota archaeon]